MPRYFCLAAEVYLSLSVTSAFRGIFDVEKRILSQAQLSEQINLPQAKKCQLVNGDDQFPMVRLFVDLLSA